MVASDGYAMAPRGEALQRRPHPRNYGTFARVLHVYAREQGLLTLPEAVRKMTSMPADQLRLADRGRVAVGCKADLVAFDPALVREESTFDEPHRLASGFRHVWVNGERVLAEGRSTGERPGRALRS
jgi:N-acyl-D-aspartate/D-glutamate deacylase